MLKEIEIKRRGGIAHVALNRPSVRNAVTLAMWRELAEIFSRFAADRDLRAVVLTGAGSDFSVGADISEFDKIRNDKQQSAEYEVAVDACSGRDRRIGKAGRRGDLRLLFGWRLPYRSGVRFSLRRSERGRRNSISQALNRLRHTKRPAAVGPRWHRERQTDPVLGRPLSRRTGQSRWV